MTPTSKVLLSCCLSSTVLFLAPLANAQDAATDTSVQELPEDLGAAPPEGHSHIGASFNEGPRQAAYLMSDWDKVHFAITTADAMGQNFFDQGIGQLHGFWYLESERSFRQVAAIDPNCAMAYWGMAMANVENEDRAAAFAHEAYKRREPVSDREQQFIDALAKYYDVDHLIAKPEKEEKEAKKAESDSTADDYASEGEEDAAPEEAVAIATPECVAFDINDRKPAKDKTRAGTFTKDLEELLYDYPHDIEAKAILVNHLWLSRRKGIPTPSRLANEALLQEIFDVNPMHPAHHYRIHLWDSKDAGKRAVSSAALSGQSYPSIAHMWHMGGHIFSSLGRHSDAAWQQEASARTDHAYMMRDGILPDQIHNFAHNNEWLTRSLRNAGRISEAIDLAKNMIELPRHPSYNRLDLGGCSSTYGRRRLIEALELYERWDELIAAFDSEYLDPVDKDTSRADRASTLAKASLFAGDLEAAKAQMVLLDELLVTAKLDRMEAVEHAEDAALAKDKKRKEVHESMSEALEDHARPIENLREKIEVARALETLLFPSPSDEASEEGDSTATTEEQLAALDALDEARFSRTHLSRLLLEAGEVERAVEMAKGATENKPGVAVLHANLTYVLWESGDKEAAREAFEVLQSFSERFELDNAPFQRLESIVNELGSPADWREPMATLPDVGERVPLASLGPFRWSPIDAPSWELPDGFGNEVALADYAGKPVLVIFFLGFGCVHCVEQLGAFEPVTQDFLDAGIPIVTIGTDTVEDLKASQENDSEEERLPFPVLSDPKLDVFKEYRCHDDFENLALHGTFLIDGQGRVRWHDISYEPFMDTEFLLKESQRLLALPDANEPIRAEAITPTPAGSGTGLR